MSIPVIAHAVAFEC